MMMMTTLSTSCFNAVVDKNWDRKLSGFNDFPLGKPHFRFFSLKSLVHARHLNLISVSRKASQPFLSFSSSSPNSQVDLAAAEAQAQKPYKAKTVHVKFKLKKDCLYGEHFYMVGGDPMFGLWDPDSAIPLTWSDGHIWTVELDIPVGKSIDFKFLVKGITGKVLWQPGPNRSFVTWETENTITVCEDWENEEFQEIFEEKFNVREDQENPNYQKENKSNKNQGLDINDNIYQVKGSLTPKVKDAVAKESLRSKAKDVAVGESLRSKAKDAAPKESLRTKAKDVAANDNDPSALKKHKAVVADDINNPIEESAKRRDKALGGRRTCHPKDKSTDISKQNVMIEKTAFGNNKRAARMKEKRSEDVEGNLIMHEGDPVLVPGLPPSSTVSNGGTIQEEDEKEANTDAAPKDHKARSHPSPELDVKPGPHDDSVQQKRTRMFCDEDEQVGNKVGQKPNLPCKDEPDSEHLRSNVIQNDVQWSHGTLQKLLQQFGNSLNKLIKIENERYY